jgi:hypothetical protein
LIENSEWPRLNHKKRKEKRRIEVMGFFPLLLGGQTLRNFKE